MISKENFNQFVTDDDVRSCYSKLRQLTAEKFSNGEGSSEASLLLVQVCEQERGLLPEERERRADLALAEGLVDVFYRAATWIGQDAFSSLSELLEKKGFDIYDKLINILSYRSCHSAKLASKLMSDDRFFKSDLLRLNSWIEAKRSDQVTIIIQNMILVCDGAATATGRYLSQGAYTIVREIYTTWMYELLHLYTEFVRSI